MMYLCNNFENTYISDEFIEIKLLGSSVLFGRFRLELNQTNFEEVKCLSGESVKAGVSNLI